MLPSLPVDQLADTAGPGFFSPGGTLDRMADAANPRLKDSGLPLWAKGLMSSSVAVNTGNGGGFALSGGGGGNGGMTIEEAMALAERLKRKFNATNEQSISTASEPKRPVTPTDFRVPQVGIGQPMPLGSGSMVPMM